MINIAIVVRAGPSNWANNFPSCGGANQSPINVISSSTQQLPSAGQKYFTFTNYGRIIDTPLFTLFNNGHSGQYNDLYNGHGGQYHEYT